MSTHFGDLLDNARRQRFVGRHREVTSFDDTLHGRSPRRVLFVHGQGGIGKTTLLLEFRARARAAGRTVVQVDGRDVDLSPEGMQTAVRLALDPQRGDSPIAQLLTGAVLLVDGYEQLTPIDGWLRNELVPGLSADNVVVLAGRDPPTVPWRTDPGWRHLVAVHRLDHFDPAESGELLAHAGVEPPVRPHLVTLGRGHPLTMALLADLAATGEVPDTLADAPDLISALLESFFREAPSEAHLTGLATCAIAWLTTEDLLRQLVGAEAPAVWQWLARRPFVTASPRGLFTHDLARDVLDAEFERRSPERCRSYRWIIQAHAVAGLRAATGPDRQPHAQQLHFLLRNSPLSSAISALRAQGSTAVVSARPDDHDQICSIIEQFEGPASAQLARAWLSEQPEHLSVVRTGDGIAGFTQHLLCPSGSVLEDRDPVVRAVLDHVAREGPTRPGERVDIARFFAGAGEHQRDLYAVLAGNVSSIIEWLTRPLAWSFIVTVDIEYWAPFFDYMAFVPMAETNVGGLRHVVYGIDWRRVPVDAWFGLMRDRGHSGETGPPPAALVRPPPLDHTGFGAAVRTALQTLHRPDQLATNPLIGSALAATPTGPKAAQLRATIENAVTCLGNEPKGDQLRTVLHRTYLRAAPTQEAAAEILDLPLSTYRRHLAKALEQLTDLLWTVEIGDLHPPEQRLDSR
ncbi:ATP-binding protein [Streptomyces sp. NBC_00243]|uniref:AAA family ATPase n=1 Tax=Streptomyces sp. NBC_00243 TaxID=2975688 RepID=UPI002DD9CE7E|nr:AAA family ATPase [Streptomyces sp. NBC_00243]WRZ25499.1 ATP-binding protein [Streptomyces sp. NBC_00243]